MAKSKTGPKGDRITPSLTLLALVGGFLEENGFSSSHRIYNTERKKRPKKEGWTGAPDKNLQAQAPSLEDIFKSWQETHPSEEAKSDESGTSSSGDEEAALEESSGSESDSEESDSDEASDVDMEDAEQAEVSRDAAASNSSSASSEGDSSSESESDSESESESDDEPAPPSKAGAAPVVANPLKRKAPESSSESSSESEVESSDSESDTSNEEPPAKKAKVEDTDTDSSSDSESQSSDDTDSDASSTSDEVKTAANIPLPESSSSGTSSSSEDTSDSESSDDESNVKKTREVSSDSSGTITGDPLPPNSRAIADGKEGAQPAVPATDKAAIDAEIRKRHVGAHPTRLAQISAYAQDGDYISNTYVSYDYADRAYNDLSVTRGKGFTKEKNKKKRGSYRGGAIDISGGKAFKFED